MSLREKEPVATKRIKIASLNLPGEWRKLLESDQTARIAKSLERFPILQRPGVRKDTKTIIWGRHRLAALAQSGAKTALVDVWDVTEEEAAEMKDVENAVRRGPDLEAQKRLLDKWSEQLAEAQRDEQLGDPRPLIQQEEAKEKPKRGRPKTERGKVREEMAAMRGVSPKTVARQDQAAAKVERHDDGKTRDESSYLWRLGAFECWGLDHLVTEQFARQVVLTREAVTDVTGKFNAVLSSITKSIEADKAVAADLDLQGVYSRTQQLASALREIYPVALCPSCKCVPDLLRRCGGCRGRGTVGKEKLEQSPRELRAGGEAAGVYVQGQFVRLSEMSA